MMDYVVINTTVDSKEAAEKLAGKIIGARLAACVQSTPIHSTYRWKGSVESADEYLLMAKTRTELAGHLTDFIKTNHSYEVPEIIVTPITGGLPAYLEWINTETCTPSE